MNDGETSSAVESCFRSPSAVRGKAATGGDALNRAAGSHLKRVIDIVGSALGLIFFLPMACVFALLVYRESPGPVIFSQIRAGRNGRPFKMYKLRTMQIGAERDDHLHPGTAPNDPRLLRIGRLMRRLNADEIPQFWNVLQGDMSLVGPRPERLRQVALLQRTFPLYGSRHASKPGMTGLAQIHGFRGATSLAGRLRYDLYYLRHWSLFLDLQIIARTLFTDDKAFR